MNNSTDSEEKHDITVIMQDPIDKSAPITSSKSTTPLSSNQTVLNARERHGRGSPFKSRFNRSPYRTQQLRKDIHSSSDSLDISTEFTQSSTVTKEEYDELERRYADVVLQYEQLKVESGKLREESQLNRDDIESLQSHLKSVEQDLADMELEKQGMQEASMQNESMYKKVIEALQNKVEDLSSQLSATNRSTATHPHGDHTLMAKYEKLLRDYKVLQHQFEVEKNSKLVLMDQIEFLAHKNEELVSQLESPVTDDLASEGDRSIEDYINDASQKLSYEEGEDVHTTADIGDRSIPNADSTSDSIKVTSHFQFPPSPDPQSKELKRQSLPTNLKTKFTSQSTEFVLSPFKLTPGPSSSTENKDGMFEDADTSIIKRYSTSKPTHVRYNSHDILPIKVEFESDSVRFTSVPEEAHKQHPEIGVIEESSYDDFAKLHHRDGTFFALNGIDSEDTGFDSSHRMSYDEFDSSSKRSSYINADGKTRQEITKLKFELQSLKLHNEKLLSYIGFELQKQKKNIKKLAKKQSTNSMRSLGKQMEYSDAKLIEESKDVLINKKRVLRSVSINTVFNKNENFATNPVGINTIGASDDGLIADPESDPCYNESPEVPGSESNFVNDKIVKKFASQIFERDNNLYPLSEDEIDSDFENDTWAIVSEGANENSRELYESSSSSSSEEELNVLYKLRSYVMGTTPKESKSKKKRKDDLVDANLKFKFLTIALGIAIIGLKLTPKSQSAIGQ
ncbi:hypothetical protein KGF57_001503 [Candida theae]|uniref:Uncharacterized protein n=1 Tax=Candida theae TaxID=1198502 RepID=A0AAD5FZQ8_9ASCO|nr:uncharacterized protein KGF57_001503 [Candida theae]KAI5962058.1 hypothetical protein KGF57_001503 [Candida theae]